MSDWQEGKMSDWQEGKMSDWQEGKMSDWQDDENVVTTGRRECRNDGTTRWQDVGTTGRRNDEMAG
jgi:hypothetical protein